MKIKLKYKSLLNQIQDDLKEKGFKITGPRSAIISFLIDTNDHPEIQDIHDEVTKKYPGIGIATVYRTIELLRELKLISIIELLDGRQRYELNLPNDHHHHLVCTDCKRIVEFGNCNFKQLIDDIESSTRFKIDSHTTTAYGLCPQCRHSK